MLVGGESAGGGITLLLIQSLIKQGLPIPCAAFCISPWADLAMTGQSYVSNVHTDTIVRPESMKWASYVCFGGEKLMRENKRDLRDPLCSPVYASFTGFPPLLIMVSEAELIASDSHTVHEKCIEAGVDVEFIGADHMMHAYPLAYHYHPEAVHALDQLQSFAEKKLKLRS